MPVSLVTHICENEQKVNFVWKELMYSYEKQNSVLTFKISDNKNIFPKGCSSFINQVFNRDFYEHSISYTNYGTVDIQFDYNFAKQGYMPVADAHGIISRNVLDDLIPLFNIFVIHIYNKE
jgi:hypothetical protein